MTFAVYGIYYKTNRSGGADRKHRQAQCALLGGLWLSCCLGQETCELNMGSVEDLAAQTHSLTHSHKVQERWKLFQDTQDLALADDVSQGIKLDVAAQSGQNKARDFLMESTVKLVQ